MSLYLGIDTSNYTTSAAIFDSRTNKMYQQKQLLPVKQGQLGLRQSDAVFHHTQQLSLLLEKLFAQLDALNIAAVGVSTRPRPVEGSYMPCFTVGENTAKILSSALNIPSAAFSHQEGHIAAALYSAGRDDLFNKRFLAFHVSGGTTEAVLAQGSDSGFSIEPVARSLDLHAGQAIDRVGLMLGLDFPCGAQLEQLALKNTEKIKIKPTLKGVDCCLSGVENQCKKLLEQGRSKNYIADYCIRYIEAALSLMIQGLIERYGDLPLVFAGGVMSDSIINNSISEKYNAVFAQPSFSTDNAAGIAYMAYKRFKNVHT